MKYTFYAISNFQGDKKVLFKCKDMEENDCLILSRFLPHKYSDKEMYYYIFSNDHGRIIELSYGRIVSILKFDAEE